MEEYTRISTSKNHAFINEPVVLREKQQTRLVFWPEVNKNQNKIDKGETVGGYLIYQKKGKNDKWKNINTENLNSLRKGEGYKVRLSSEECRILYKELANIYKLSEHIDDWFGTSHLIVANEKEVIPIPDEKISIAIQHLIKQNHEDKIWQELIDSKPGLATKMAYARLQSERESNSRSLNQC